MKRRVECPAAVPPLHHPTSAWLAGLNLNYEHVQFGQTQFINSLTSELRYGLRYYRETSERTRPFISIAGTFGYVGGDFHGIDYGGLAEYGAAYFFSPHV